MRVLNREWGAARAALTAAALAVLAACGGGGGESSGPAAAAAAAADEPEAQVLALSVNEAVPRERYVLVNQGSGQCIDAVSASGDGGRLRQADCNGGLNQAFDVAQDSAGRFKLIVVGTGKVVDLAGSSGADGATIHQWSDNGTLAQRFALQRSHGNRFALVNAGSNKCVAIGGDGASLQQASCADVVGQQFRLHPVASGGRTAPAVGQYNLRSVHSRLCLEIEGGSSADGARVLQANCAAADAQRYDVVPNGSGAYRIASLRSGKSLDVSGASTANGAAIVQWGDAAGANQRFTATAVGDAFLLQPKHSGKCVDVAGFSTAVGGAVHQWDCTRNNNQLWQLVPETDTPPPATGGKSVKRGVAYDLATTADLAALSPGVSWWYNWSPRPNPGAPADAATRYGMDFVPMLWNGNFNDAEVESLIKANPRIQYLLVLNEPNLYDQANMTPAQAAALWPRYEALASRTGVKIVGPAITWGTVAGFEDPVVWLDAFYAAYRAANGQRDPRIDYLAFHWYDYGLAGQLDRLKKYNKPFWVTEFANWHGQNDGAQIDTMAKQKAQMTDMVATCEGRADVFRYAWFTGRWNNDTHFSSLLGADGQLTELGTHYLSLPVSR